MMCTYVKTCNVVSLLDLVGEYKLYKRVQHVFCVQKSAISWNYIQ